MKTKWIVSKFGGSSVKDAAAMLRCCQIVENNPLIKIVVISATQNTTNQLETVARAAERGDSETLNNVTNELISKHLHIAQDLFSSSVILEELEALFGELKALGSLIQNEGVVTHKTMDELYSLGERMSSLIISDLIRLRLPNKKVILLDARKIIKTSSDFLHAEPQIDLIAKNANVEMHSSLNDNTIFVTQGFIGSDLLGNTTTLGREGSDFSATLFGEAIDADLVQIWTDVPGVASCDPRIVKNVQFIKELSYDEATALATLGAKVLFPTTLNPTKRKNIPVFVGSSLNPDLGGTIITKDQKSTFGLKAVSQLMKNDQVYVSFIGTHLDEKEDLMELLLKELGDQYFEFYDLTSVSISFKVLSSKMDKGESMNLAHDVLMKLHSLF
jgi:aspartate kinase